MEFSQKSLSKWRRLGFRIRGYRKKGHGLEWEVWQRRTHEIILVLPRDSGYHGLPVFEKTDFEKVLVSCGAHGKQVLWWLRALPDTNTEW